MPQEAEKDNFDDDVEVAEATKPEPKAPVVAPAPPRLHSKLRADAERLGIAPEYIEECQSNADLRHLIDHEMALLREERANRAPTAPKSAPAPKAPETVAAVSVEAEEEWKLEEDSEKWVDETIKKELKKIGSAILKAKKGGDKEEVAELKKLLDATNAKLERMESRAHPLVRRANAHVAKYPVLFGEDFDEDGRPPAGTDAAVRYWTMIDHIFKANADGKTRATGNPEADIDAAIKVLFPGHELSQSSVSAPLKPSNGTNRISQWADSAQASTTARNGAERSGKPGGEKEAVKKAAAVMKKHGLDPGHVDDDDDDDI